MAEHYRFDFMKNRKGAMVFSVCLIVLSLGSLVFQQLNFGQDFTGGTLVELGYSHAADVKRIRQVLKQDGFDDVVVQHFGSEQDVLIRIAPRSDLAQAKLGDQVTGLLLADDSSAVLRRVEFVGPQVGRELTEDGVFALLVALFGVLVYVAFRFEYRFALGSVVALIHDVVITLGFFSIFRWEFDLNVLAAVLAVIGYSLNDTIVVFDRIRENFREVRRGDTNHVVNLSLNQTLSRTLVTSLTTALVLVALLLFGGELIHGFALALLVGVFVGTYSSVYVASNVLVVMGLKREDLLPPVKEGADDRDVSRYLQ